MQESLYESVIDQLGAFVNLELKEYSLEDGLVRPGMELITDFSNLCFQFTVLFLRLEIPLFKCLKELGILGSLGLLDSRKFLRVLGVRLSSLFGLLFKFDIDVPC